MKKETIIILSLTLIFLGSMSCVCAIDSDGHVLMNDTIQTNNNDNAADSLLANVDTASYDATIIENDGSNNNDQTNDIIRIDPKNFSELLKEIQSHDEGSVLILLDDCSYDDGFNQGDGVPIEKQITIDGNGHSLNGKDLSRILYVDADNVVLKNINFINGNHADAAGALLIRACNTIIENCTFKDNKCVKYGGAIFIEDYCKSNNKIPVSNINILNSIFESNSANGGGGIYGLSKGNLIKDSTFKNNKAKTLLGGAVLISQPDNQIVHNTFISNSAAKDGGALALQYSSNQLVANNTFIKNTGEVGGGLNLYDGGGYTIINNVFDENSASDLGGAIRLKITDTSTESKIENNIFNNNNAYVGGGAIYCDSDKAKFIKNTFKNNKATTKSGGAIQLNGKRNTVSYNTFDKCSASHKGGAVYIESDTNTIQYNNITNCHAGNGGGAIYITGSSNTINNNDLISNGADSIGGAIQISGDGTTISDNKFTQDTAKGNGGAIFSEGKNTKVTRNIITKCTSQKSGGGACLSGSGNVVGNEITGCSAAQYGGGIYFTSNDFTLSGNAFKSNSAQKGSDYYPTDMPSGSIATTITATDVTTTYGTKNYIIATLKDKDGTPIRGAKIGFANNGVTYVNTDADGKARYYTTELLPGTYTVNVKFFGDDNYDPSSITAKVTINKLETKLIAKYDKNSENIIATVKDANGNLINGLKVGFNIDGMKYVTTDANGQAKYSTANLPDNTYTINVMAYGNDIYKDSNKETVTFTIGNKEQAKIYLRNALYFVLQTKIVTVTLWDSTNNPIAGKTVYINLDEYGSKYSGVTDEDGNAYIRVGVGFGNHPSTVSFEGDDEYNAASKTGRVRVIKETPSLMLPGAYTKFKATNPTKTIKVYLKDRYNKPLLPGTKVFVTINGKQYVGSIDTEGIATININLNKVGVYNVDLYYTGNTAYNAVRRTTKITII